jgi:signal transduction histidine kinase/CheY-like chemotaxis protein
MNATVLHARSPDGIDRFLFALVSIGYAAMTAAFVPLADAPGETNPRIVLAYGASILIADLCTVLLLAVHYRAGGRTALLILLCAYLFSTVMAALHVVLFPGALLAQPAFGGGQAVSWLYAAWRLGTAGLYLAAVLAAGRPARARPQRQLDRQLAGAIALTLVLACAAALIAAHLDAEGMIGGRFSALGRNVQWASVLVCAAALAVIWVRRAFDEVLYLWLGVVLVAWIADLTLSNLSGGLFTLGWHVAKANFVVSACLLAAVLLADAARDGIRSRAEEAAAYGTAVAVAIAAVYLRWFFDPWLSGSVIYGTLYGAAAIAVWFGGWGPAAFASVVGYLLVNLLFIEPRGHLGISESSDALALALFGVSCTLVIVLGEGMRRARNRYRESEAALRERALELQRADANKSRFLAILSHELRNPLAPLRTGLAILARQREPGAPGKIHDMMERQIRQLTRLIDDLLDVSRIDRGKLELKRERVALDAVARTAIETSSPNIAAKSLELMVRYSPQPLHVHGDAVRLAQALSNLLNNAAKYTPAGGHIELSLRAEGAEAVVGVADDGIGLAPEHLARVFDMFYQVDGGGSAAAGGLGLGLTLARSIVDQHGGRIEARSAGPAQGSEFVIRLPLADAAAPAAEHAAPGVRAIAGRRVLVVDDNADAARTLAELLRLDGHRVEIAGDGADALRIAEAQRPELVFLDLNMPGMDGFDLALRLRATPWGQDARLVALTGMGQQADIARTRGAGFDEHLTKPADPARVTELAAGTGAFLRAGTR